MGPGKNIVHKCLRELKEGSASGPGRPLDTTKWVGQQRW